MNCIAIGTVESPLTDRDQAPRQGDEGAPEATIHLNLAEPSGVLARDCDNTLWRERYGPPDDVSLREGFRRLIDWMETT